MNKGSGIVIDIGFTSDISKYIRDLESKIKAVDFQKMIGLSEAFDAEYKKVHDGLIKLKTELDSMGGGNALKINEQLVNIEKTTNQLTKAFDILLASIPKNAAEKSGLNGIRKALTDIQDIGTATKDVLAEISKTSENVEIINEEKIQQIKEAYNQLLKLKRITQGDERRKFGGYDDKKFTDLKLIISDTVAQYNRLTKAKQDYNNIKSGKQEGNIDKELINITQSAERIQGLANLYEKITGSKDYTIKTLGVSFSKLYSYADEQLSYTNGLIEERLKEWRETGLKNGFDPEEFFTKSTRKTQGEINVPMMIAPGTTQKLKDQINGIMGSINAYLDKNPATVEVRLVSAYASKVNKKIMDEVQTQIADLRKEAANAGGDEFGFKLGTMSDELKALIDKMNAQIENAMIFTVNVETEDAIKKVNTFVEAAKEQLEGLKKLSSDENSLKLIKEMLEIVKEIGKELQSVADPLKVLASNKFTEDIEARNSALSTLYTQLEKINPMLTVFTKGIAKLDDEKVQKNLVAMTSRAAEIIKEATDLVSPMLPEGRAGDIKLEVKNKAEIIEAISEVRSAVRDIFSPIVIDMWEQRFLEALATIKTETGYIFDANTDKKALNLLSLTADDISISDQIMRMAGVKNKEHGAVLTTDGRVLGSHTYDKADSTRMNNAIYYEKLLGITIDKMLATIHSHAGQIAWSPSEADLARIIDSGIANSITVAEKEIAIANRQVFIDFLKENNMLKTDENGKIKAEESVKELSNLINDYIKAHDFKNDAEYKEFIKPFNEQIQELKEKGVKTGNQEAVYKSRYALTKVLSEKYGTELESLFQVMTHEQLAQNNPFGFNTSSGGGLNMLTDALQKSVEKALSQDTLSEINNSVKEIITILNEGSFSYNGVSSKNAKIQAEIDAIDRELDFLMTGGKSSEKRTGIVPKDQEKAELMSSTLDDVLKKYSKFDSAVANTAGHFDDLLERAFAWSSVTGKHTDFSFTGGHNYVNMGRLWANKIQPDSALHTHPEDYVRISTSDPHNEKSDLTTFYTHLQHGIKTQFIRGLKETLQFDADAFFTEMEKVYKQGSKSISFEDFLKDVNYKLSSNFQIYLNKSFGDKDIKQIQMSKQAYADYIENLSSNALKLTKIFGAENVKNGTVNNIIKEIKSNISNIGLEKGNIIDFVKNTIPNDYLSNFFSNELIEKIINRLVRGGLIHFSGNKTKSEHSESQNRKVFGKYFAKCEKEAFNYVLRELGSGTSYLDYVKRYDNATFDSKIWKKIIPHKKNNNESRPRSGKDTARDDEIIIQETSSEEEKLAQARKETAQVTEQAAQAELKKAEEKPQSEFDKKLAVLRNAISGKSFDIRTKEGKQNLDAYAQQIINETGASNGTKTLEDILNETAVDAKVRDKLANRIRQIILEQTKVLAERLEQATTTPATEENVVSEAELEGFDEVVDEALGKRAASLIERILKNPQAVLDEAKGKKNPDFTKWFVGDIDQLNEFMNGSTFKSIKGNKTIKKAFEKSIKEAQEIRAKAIENVFKGEGLGRAFLDLFNLSERREKLSNEINLLNQDLEEDPENKAIISKLEELSKELVPLNQSRTSIDTLIKLYQDFAKNPADESILAEIRRASKEFDPTDTIKKGVGTKSSKEIRGSIGKFFSDQYTKLYQELNRLMSEESTQKEPEELNKTVTVGKWLYEKWYKSTERSKEYKNQNFKTAFDQLIKDHPEFKQVNDETGKIKYQIEIQVNEDRWNKFLADLDKQKEKSKIILPSKEDIEKARILNAFKGRGNKLLNKKDEDKLIQMSKSEKDPNRDVAKQLLSLHNRFSAKPDYDIAAQFREALGSLKVSGKNTIKDSIQKYIEAIFTPPVNLKDLSKEELGYLNIKNKYGNKILSDTMKERLQYYADDEKSSYYEIAKQIIDSYNSFLAKPDMNIITKAKSLVNSSNLTDKVKEEITSYLNEILKESGLVSEKDLRIEELLARKAKLQAKIVPENENIRYVNVARGATESVKPLTAESKVAQNVATTMDTAAEKKEAFATANEKVAGSAEKSATQIVAETSAVKDLIGSLKDLPQTKNPLLEQLENIAKNKDALKALGNTAKGNDKATTPKGTLEDAQKLLTNNGAKVRTQVSDYIAKRLGVLTPEQIEAASKTTQDALNKSWGDYNVVSELVASGKMEPAIAEEYAGAFVDTYKNAMAKGLNVSLSDEQKQFLEPMMSEIQKLVPQGSNEFLITELKATKDGLIDITALIKGVDGEYQKLLLTYQQLGNKSSIWVKDIKMGADAAKAFEKENAARLASLVKEEDVVDNIGNVKFGTESWERLVALAKEYGIEVRETDKIIRNNDRGRESFQFFTHDGSRHTLGISSEGKLFERNKVASPADDENEYRKLVGNLSATAQKAFVGDENAAEKFANILERIVELWRALTTYRDQGFIDDNKIAELQALYNGEFGTIAGRINGINTNNKSDKFISDKETLIGNFADVREQLDLTDIANKDAESFKALKLVISQAFSGIISLMASAREESSASEKQVNTWISKMGDYLKKNSAIPREYKKQISQLIQEARKLQAQYNNNVPKELMTPIINEFTAIDSKMKELGYSGRSMFDKMKNAMKNSILQVTRMYLSWYRLISYIRQGVQDVINLDTALTKMSYTMNVTNAQLQNMGKEMVNMAKDLSSSVENISQIYQIYANLQTTQEELEKTARPTAVLANLSGVDAATAADQIQGVLNQFKLAADDAEHIVDVYDKISASIKVDYSKGIAGMADAVKNVGNFASEAGLSFEQLSAIIGRVMQQTRQEGGQIGVALKTIMTRISKANKIAEDGEVDNKTLSQASAALNRVGIDVYDELTGEYRKFDTIMTELANTWDKLTDAEQASISFAIAATRQTATLRAILQNWTGAMDLATEAVEANGNALANQAKYEESVAGRMQALKTELSALWIELVDTDAIKSLLDSVKEMVVSLEDGTTGLKPIIDLLTEILKLISKIISTIPASGLILSILGLKFGKSISSALISIFSLKSGLVGLIKEFGFAEVAAMKFGTALDFIAANPIGAIIIALTTTITIFKALGTTTDELEQKFQDLSRQIETSNSKITTLNNELKTQQNLINEINNEPLDAITAQQLQNAIDTTGQLERQLEIEKEKKKITTDTSMSTKIKEWDKEGYLDAWEATQRINPEYMDEVDIENAKAYAIKINEQLNNTKDLYEEALTKQDALSLTFVDYYEKIKEAYEGFYRIGWSDIWNQTAASSLLGETKLQNSFKQLESEAVKWYEKNPLWKHMGLNPITAIAEMIKSGNYSEIQDAINDAVFTEDLTDDKKIELLAEQFFKTVKEKFTGKAVELRSESNGRGKIDLATWFTDPSSIDSDKTWNEITDSIESGLNSIGEALKKHRSGNEVLNPYEIFKITDTKDSIFQQLGFDKFETYLSDYTNRLPVELRKDLEANGKLVEFALTDYIKDVYGKALSSFGDVSDVEGFNVLTEQLEKWIHAAEGGSNEINTLIDSYHDLMSVYAQVKNGEDLSAETVTRLITQYGDLQDSIKITGDSYSIEKDALVSLINQYIGYSNTAIAAELNTAQTLLDSTKVRIESMGYEIETLRKLKIEYASMYELYANTDIQKELFREYRSQGMPIEEAMKQAKEDAKNIGAISILDEYDATEDYIESLKKLLAELDASQESFKKAANSIDWIANSLENITRAAENAKRAYDNLFSTSGSLKGVEQANAKLEELNAALHKQELGAQQAEKAYLEEFNKLNLDDEWVEKIKNAALEGKEAWQIEEFEDDDSEFYDKINKGLDYMKKSIEAGNQVADLRHQQAENDIQALQNYSDYYGKLIEQYESEINSAIGVEKKQKLVDEILEATNKQYEYDIAIAKANGDMVTVDKLRAEQIEKQNELLVRQRQISIDATAERYDRIMGEFDKRQSILEHGIAMTEAKGSLVSTKYYQALIDNERDGIDALRKERKLLIDDLNKIDTTQEGGVEQWNNTKQKIDEVTQSLYESEEALREWANAIRQVKWDLFDRITDTIHGIADESEYIANLFAHDDPFKYVKEGLGDDKMLTKLYSGEWSKEGLAILGMYELQIKTNKELAEDYANEIKKLNKEIAEHPTDLNLIDRRNELIQRQREAIQAVEDEKQAILDLIREGYDKQLESMQTLIDKYMEALQKEKD